MNAYKLLPRALRFVEHPLFSVVLIVAGFSLLAVFARASEKAKLSQLVHPVTKQPLVNPMYPAIRRATWAFLASLVAALGISLYYKTPVHSYVVIERLPLSLRHPSVPEWVWKPPVPYNDAHLEILYNQRKLDGQSLSVNKANPKVIELALQLHNRGTMATLQWPSCRLYLSVPCGAFVQEWVPVASDEAGFPSEFYMGQTTAGPTGPPINAGETWSWPEFACQTGKDVTEDILGKVKFFYGAQSPSQAKFVIRKPEQSKPSSQ
jgi:hypothetical protein